MRRAVPNAALELAPFGRLLAREKALAAPIKSVLSVRYRREFHGCFRTSLKSAKGREPPTWTN